MAGTVATTRNGGVDTSDNSALTGRVIPPGGKPQTEYVLLQNKQRGNSGRNAPEQAPERQSNRNIRISAGRSSGGSALGNTNGIGYAWIAAMILVGFDEWKNNGILPRPARLWDTSLLYGLLALGSSIDLFAPLATALAWGYFFVLLWQFYNGQGQFQ